MRRERALRAVLAKRARRGLAVRSGADLRCGRAWRLPVAGRHRGGPVLAALIGGLLLARAIQTRTRSPARLPF
jgi:hypothetical protein